VLGARDGECVKKRLFVVRVCCIWERGMVSVLKKGCLLLECVVFGSELGEI